MHATTPCLPPRSLHNGKLDNHGSSGIASDPTAAFVLLAIVSEAFGIELERVLTDHAYGLQRVAASCDRKYTFCPLPSAVLAPVFLQVRRKGFKLKDSRDAHEIHMRQPAGFIVNGKEDWVLRVHRSLYGLKASGREWYLTLAEALGELDYKPSNYDPCIFISTATILALYVDDILLIAKTPSAATTSIKKLQERFTRTELSSNSAFLGVVGEGLDNPSQGVQIHQRPYIKAILNRLV